MNRGPHLSDGVVGLALILNFTEKLMKTLLIAALVLLGVRVSATQDISAAHANGLPIANALSDFDNTKAEPVACSRVCNWRGCWTRCWGGPAYVAPLAVAPLVVAPACRSIRVCDFRGCWWRRKCW